MKRNPLPLGKSKQIHKTVCAKKSKMWDRLVDNVLTDTTMISINCTNKQTEFNRACLSHRSYVFPRKFRVYFFWVEMIQFMLKLHEMTLKVDFSA